VIGQPRRIEMCLYAQKVTVMYAATANTVEVRVGSACDIAERLDAAVQDLQSLASRTRHGILVTRLNPGHYTVSLSDKVPFGLTREQVR
jgi:hypothetical protein